MKRYKIQRQKDGNYALYRCRWWGWQVFVRDIPSETLMWSGGRLETMIFESAVPPRAWGVLEIIFKNRIVDPKGDGK